MELRHTDALKTGKSLKEARKPREAGLAGYSQPAWDTETGSEFHH